MPYFLRHNDKMINLDLVASISKSYHDTIIFYGAYLDKEIACLQFDDEEIRDKIFNDICNNIQLHNFRSFIEIKN